MLTPNEEYPDLAQNLGVEHLFLKREDIHPLGSHKGRSIPKMIDTYLDQGIEEFAISSSGNASLAGALYIKELNKNGRKIQLQILVGQNINNVKLEKLKVLEDENMKVTMHDRPLQTLFNITKDSSIKSLRQSTDDTAILGYKDLAKELLEIPDLEAVFVGTSSGTTAQSLLEFFASEKRKVEVNIVQTSSCHPISDEFIETTDTVLDEKSIADAIVDQTALRKKTLVDLIKNSSGKGYIASNEQIESAIKICEEYTSLSISANSALSIVGLMQSVYTGKKYKAVACIICGE